VGVGGEGDGFAGGFWVNVALDDPDVGAELEAVFEGMEG
jgi:hypothetical protein